MGGTSTLNGMMYIRGARKDYDDWAALGNEGWSYNEVLPHFLKSEDNKQIEEMDQGYHTEGGLLTVSQFPYHPPLSKAILKGAEELGLYILIIAFVLFILKQILKLISKCSSIIIGYPIRDLNGIYHSGFNIAQTTNRNGSRLSSSRAFIRPFKNRRNLHILMNATVTKVLINSTTKKAYGVEVLRKGAKENIYATKEVIVSAGNFKVYIYEILVF